MVAVVSPRLQNTIQEGRIAALTLILYILCSSMWRTDFGNSAGNLGGSSTVNI
jgi:hypothetical protein